MAAALMRRSHETAAVVGSTKATRRKFRASASNAMMNALAVTSVAINASLYPRARARELTTITVAI